MLSATGLTRPRGAGANFCAVLDTLHAHSPALDTTLPSGAPAPALGLNLLTPAGFLTAISERTDPSAADKATIDNQIKTRQLKVYVYNSQNATPDVQAQVNEAKAAAIPVTTITETLTPAGATFQDWQVAQLNALQQALAQGTAR